MPLSKVLLVILDGWGLSERPEVSAIAQAQTPFFDNLWKNFPHTRLKAHGEAVGLPPQQMGNSEVGHLNIGAGRIVDQDIIRIRKALQQTPFKNAVFEQLIHYLKENPDKNLHLIGLVSDGGVHSDFLHLKGLLKHLKAAEIPNKVYIHAFTDGRDTSPKSALNYLEQLQTYLNQLQLGTIATIIGRYYAMDRDKRWDRTAKAYHLLVHNQGTYYENWRDAIESQYQQGITDEFLKPSVVYKACIAPNDAVLFFNFRADRARQLTRMLTLEPFEEQNTQPLPLFFVTLTNYDDDFTAIPVLFEKFTVDLPLGEVLAQNGLTQLRIAETEKYAHVTYFFNGGREEPFEKESRILVPSPKVATYDLKPEMSAFEVTDQAIRFIEKHAPDFICLNYANPDMVGHTGVFEAAVKACEAVDQCNRRLIAKALDLGYTCIITADHGNADKMYDEEGKPHTAHTLAEVPFIIVTAEATHYSLKKGVLGNIAPTILELMGIPIPETMQCESLIQK